MAETIFVLNGLGCANCAQKIEKQAGKINGVTEAIVSFSTQEIRIRYVNEIKGYDELKRDIEKIAKNTEPGVFVTGTEDKEKTQNSESGSMNGMKKAALFTAIAGIAIFVTALISGPDGVPRLLIFLTAYLLLGWDVILTALKNIFRGEFFDENFLMSISTIGAFCINEYPEAVAVMLFYKAGEYLQEKAVGSSRKSVRSLLELKPEYANVDSGIDGIVKIDPSSVLPGQEIIVLPGEKVPLDGIITEGSSSIDSSPVTGESLPAAVSEGTEILSGVLNIDGRLKIKVTKDYSNSTVAKIMRLVEDAASKKAPVERFITKFSKIYTPAVIIMAALLSIIPPLVTGAEFSLWFGRALVFLVISCPCALVISVPLSFFAGIGAASKAGALVKGGNILQTLAGIDTVVFDKTGTLTKSRFEVTAINAASGIEENSLLSLAFSVERYSNHPLAKALSREYERRGLDGAIDVNDVREIPGFGLSAVAGGETIYCGNERLMSREGFNLYHAGNNSSGSVIHAAKGGTYLGFIEFSDEIKDGARAAVEKLRSLGVKDIAMLTGDRQPSAEHIAEKAGIRANELYAELLPHQKVEVIERLYADRPERKTAFIGDGINDAPALARCDTGIAMGGIGSDAAIEAADVVIMNDDLTKIPESIGIARKTMSIVRQNIAFAIACKLAVLAISAFGLASMWMAVFADVGVCLLVVLNSMRIQRRVEK